MEVLPSTIRQENQASKLERIMENCICRWHDCQCGKSDINSTKKSYSKLELIDCRIQNQIQKSSVFWYINNEQLETDILQKQYHL